jgi:DNA ligase-1
VEHPVVDAPRVRPMLAHTDAVLPQDIVIAAPGGWLSPKYDGIRSIHREGMCQSRTLKPIPNLYIQKCLADPRLHGMDGELIVGDPTDENCYHTTESAVMRRGDEPDFTYYVFDIWSTPAVGFRQRYSTLKRRVRALRGSGLRVVLVPQVHLQTNAQVSDAMAELYEAGWEGGIWRSYNSRYKYNRSTELEGFMLKLKEHSDGEFQITRLVEQRTNANKAEVDERGFTKRSSHKANKVAAGTLGKLEGIDCATGMAINVGTGKMTAAIKQMVWDNPEEFLGAVAKYRSAKHGVLVKPRHPRWTGWRTAIDMGEPE